MRLLLWLIALNGLWATLPEAHAFSKAKPKDLSVLAGVYQTRYTGPDLLDPEAIRKVCPQMVILDLMENGRHVANEADAKAIAAAILGLKYPAPGEVPPRYVRVLLSSFASVEPAPYAPKVPDENEPGKSRVARFSYDLISHPAVVKNGLGIRTELKGTLEPATRVEINTLYQLVGGVVTIHTQTHSADFTLDLINRQQFITHTCELTKIPAKID